MIVSVPFRYAAQVVYAGKRTVEGVKLSSETSCKVRETEAAEAPIAAWYPVSRHASYAIRSFDGALYKPTVQDLDHLTGLTMYQQGGRPTPKDQSGAVRIAPRAHGKVALVSTQALTDKLKDGDFVFEPGRQREPVMARLEDLHLRRVDHSSHEAVAAQVQELVSRFLVVDDVVYQRCGVPIYNIDFIGHGRFSPTYMGLGVYGGGGGVFSIREYAAASELYAGYLSARGGGSSEFSPIAPAPEILLPDAFPAEVDDYALECTVGTVLRRFSNVSDRGGRARLSTLPKELVMAFGELRDAHSRIGSEGRDPVLDALAAFMPTLSPHGTLSDMEADIGRLLGRPSLARPSREPTP